MFYANIVDYLKMDEQSINEEEIQLTHNDEVNVNEHDNENEHEN